MGLITETVQENSICKIPSRNGNGYSDAKQTQQNKTQKFLFQNIEIAEPVAEVPLLPTVRCYRLNENQHLRFIVNLFCDIIRIYTDKISFSQCLKRRLNTIGFIGLGEMGSIILPEILASGYNAIIWDKAHEKSKKFLAKWEHISPAGCTAIIGTSPIDVYDRTDVTFTCVSDSAAALEVFRMICLICWHLCNIFCAQVVFGENGISGSHDKNKAYVEMSVIDHRTSEEIAASIRRFSGCAYLEAQVRFGHRICINDFIFHFFCFFCRSQDLLMI